MSAKRVREDVECGDPTRLDRQRKNGEFKTIQFNTMAMAFRSACQRAEASGETYPIDIQLALHHTLGIERAK